MNNIRERIARVIYPEVFKQRDEVSNTSDRRWNHVWEFRRKVSRLGRTCDAEGCLPQDLTGKVLDLIDEILLDGHKTIKIN